MTLSVLLSIYAGERADYLDACLASVWDAQSVRPDEIVLVEDGAVPPELEAVVAAWQARLGATLRVVRLPQNQGLGAALNAGVLACSGTLVARIDADDTALPTRFQSQLDYLHACPTVDIVGTWAQVIDADGNPVGTMTRPEDHATIRRLIWTCPVIHPSVMFRRSSLLKVGSYDLHVPRRQEDYELWVRAMRGGLVFHNLPQPLIVYRQADERKNGIRVGWNRLWIGWPAARQFDPRLGAYLGVTYPLLRALLPKGIAAALMPLARRLDPRRGWTTGR